ncbi:transcriptional regulator, IclR family [Oryzisolibacter propanilivorax]|uniref:Transcriptional regulator, IclR family n=1 Tax=Oryzisolibacter propanilivorax TaxID=1527607 RepID=A0A1G9QJJ6_9BURK|nr:helix-turn-helix domain-containing protein [Oryzisolibacter propanilivorax]SDM11060.1 transcriptional regulator, IclR family [Oryzisolibacter propanilivorax]
MDTSAGTSGAQSLRRALQLLRLLAEHQEQGIRLTDTVAATGLERSTVHRLLSCLVEERFAERDGAGKAYRLGVDAMQLGFASMRRAPLVDMLRPLMQRLARLSGDTVFLVIRQGDYCLCLHREEGHFPVKVFTTDVGGRRLLGLGAGGLALLAALEDAEAERIFERHAPEYAQAGFTRESLLQAVRRTRSTGWADIVDTLTTGVSGVGITFAASASTQAAISFGAITPRLPPQRKAEMAQLLQAQLAGWDTARPALAPSGQTPSGA